MRAVALTGCLLAFPALCGAQALDTVAKPDVNPGEWWIYRRMNYRTNEVVETYDLQVTFAQNDVIHGVVTRHKEWSADDIRVRGVPTIAANKDGQTDATWTSEWNSISTADGAVQKTHSGIFRFPLRSGMSYRAQYEFRRPREGERGQKGEHTVQIGGWEDVVVPAGTFRALKVEARGHYERLDARVRGSETTICWYVPVVKRSVKCTYESGPIHRGEELVAFEVRR